MKMMNKTLKKGLSLILTFVMILVSCQIIFAEGSVSLNSSDNTKSMRAYTEYYDSTTAGIIREQKIEVYAYAGEQLLFGSSVYDSYRSGAVQDIGMVLPGETVVNYYNVEANGGKGHINTVAKEQAGPCYTYEVDGNTITVNEGGYTPIDYTVEKTGIYTFYFYAPYNNDKGNPTVTSSASGWGVEKNTVGAWDVTVVKNYKTGNDKSVPGRAFCYYLCLNMGGNFYGSLSLNDFEKGLYGRVYVLTDDGYIYETDFNGMDPYGFVFFATNRGLIDPVSGTSFYHSARDSTTDNSMNNLLATLANGSSVVQPTYHLPTSANTELDKTFRIFFEVPADDLPESIKATPHLPGSVENFKFTGFVDGLGYVGQGGIFSFDVQSASSFQIKLEFADDYGGTGRKANTRYISNAAANGHNIVYWDGLDGNGDIVPAGIYGEGGAIKITIEVKAGEYHFPMLDVESNPQGVKVKLVNNPLDADGNEVYISEENRSKIFYDNSLIIQEGAEKAGSTASAENKTTRGDWTYINTQLYALDGISSLNGACRFMATTPDNAKINGGDYAFIDVWTYTIGSGTTSVSTLESFQLVEESAATDAQLMGVVYFDYNQKSFSATTTFKLNDGDYPLGGIKVEIYDQDGSTIVATAETDLNGRFYVTGLEIGKQYDIRIYAPYSSAVFTTHNSGVATDSEGNKYLLITTPALTGGQNTLVNTANTVGNKDVGISYETVSGAMTVTKIWQDSLTADPTRPETITIRAIGSYNGVVYITLDKTIDLSTGWSVTFYELPAVNDDGNTLEYSYEEIGCDDYILTVEHPSATDVIFTNAARKITLIKELTEPAESNQSFIFRIDGDTDETPGTDITFNVVLTVEKDSKTASVDITHLPAGVYTITELSGRTHYQIDASSTKTFLNGTESGDCIDGASLKMTVDNAGTYTYKFVNLYISGGGLDNSVSVINNLVPLNT